MVAVVMFVLHGAENGFFRKITSETSEASVATTTIDYVSTLLIRVLIAKKVLKYAQSIEETQIRRFWDIYTVPS
jgi:hypothetical protein